MLTVICDANVLYSAPLRDLLIRISQKRAIHARWTEEILDERFQSILSRRPDLAADSLLRTRSLMSRAVRDCIVSGYEDRISGLSLPDPNDRHVLAAALEAEASMIITFNIKDFPTSVLAPLEIEAVTPDDLLMRLLEREPSVIVEAIAEQASALRSPPCSVGELLETLAEQGVRRSMGVLRTLVSY